MSELEDSKKDELSEHHDLRESDALQKANDAGNSGDTPDSNDTAEHTDLPHSEESELSELSESAEPSTPAESKVETNAETDVTSSKGKGYQSYLKGVIALVVLAVLLTSGIVWVKTQQIELQDQSEHLTELLTESEQRSSRKTTSLEQKVAEAETRLQAIQKELNNASTAFAQLGEQFQTLDQEKQKSEERNALLESELETLKTEQRSILSQVKQVEQVVSESSSEITPSISAPLHSLLFLVEIAEEQLVISQYIPVATAILSKANERFSSLLELETHSTPSLTLLKEALEHDIELLQSAFLYPRTQQLDELFFLEGVFDYALALQQYSYRFNLQLTSSEFEKAFDALYSASSPVQIETVLKRAFKSKADGISEEGEVNESDEKPEALSAISSEALAEETPMSRVILQYLSKQFDRGWSATQTFFKDRIYFEVRQDLSKPARYRPVDVATYKSSTQQKFSMARAALYLYDLPSYHALLNDLVALTETQFDLDKMGLRAHHDRLSTLREFPAAPPTRDDLRSGAIIRHLLSSLSEEESPLSSMEVSE